MQSSTSSKPDVGQLRSDTSGSENGMVLRGRRVGRRREDEGLLRKVFFLLLYLLKYLLSLPRLLTNLNVKAANVCLLGKIMMQLP